MCFLGVYTDGQLVSLYCEVHDLTPYATPPTAAAAIAHNEETINDLEKKVEKFSSLFSKWWPALPMGLLLFNNGLELVSTQLQRTYRMVWVPIQTIRAPRVFADDLLPEWTTLATLTKALAAMVEQQRTSSISKEATVTLFAYDPGKYPGRFTPLLRSSSTETVQFSEGTEARSTSESTSISQQMINLTSDQAFVSRTGTLSASVGFKIFRSDGREQTFFIQMDTSLDTDSSKAIGEMGVLANRLKEIFKKP